MQHPTAIEKIEDAVKWYRSQKVDFNDVDLLLRVQRDFAGNLFEFATETVMLGKQKSRCEFQRKAEFSRLQRDYIGKGDSAAKARATAEADIVGLLREESDSEAEYLAAKTLLVHARDVLSTMVQHISHLKAEKRMEYGGQGSQSV